MNCKCGNEIETMHGKYCPECLHKVRSEAGKNTFGRKAKGNRKAGSGPKRVYVPHYKDNRFREERLTSEPTITMEARCLSCPGMGWHNVTILKSEAPPSGRVLWMYCDRHKHNREFRGELYGVSGMRTTGRRAAHA